MSKFKKGDRVRLLQVNGIERYGRQGEEGTILVADDGANDSRVAFDKSGTWYAPWDYLEPVVVAPATATLQIEAGKFYKTRDGRKVGPLVVQDGFHMVEGYHYASNGECCYLGMSGDDPYPDRDLVAEWIDEPSVPAPAPTPRPAILPEVGDTVLVTGEVTSITTIASGTHYGVTLQTASGNSISLHFNAGDLIIIPPTEGTDSDNDNAPPPLKPDTSAAFDALADSIFGLTVRVREAA